MAVMFMSSSMVIRSSGDDLLTVHPIHSIFFLMMTIELYEEILKEYKESGSEQCDDMFLSESNYVGGYKHSNPFTPYRSQSILNDF